MSPFLANLAARVSGADGQIEPRLPTRFEAGVSGAPVQSENPVSHSGSETESDFIALRTADEPTVEGRRSKARRLSTAPVEELRDQKRPAQIPVSPPSSKGRSEVSTEPSRRPPPHPQLGEPASRLSVETIPDHVSEPDGEGVAQPDDPKSPARVAAADPDRVRPREAVHGPRTSAQSPNPVSPIYRPASASERPVLPRRSLSTPLPQDDADPVSSSQTRQRSWMDSFVDGSVASVSREELPTIESPLPPERPSIQVHIGHIEIRAERPQPQSVPHRPRVEAPRPNRSLSTYLDGRKRR